MLPNAAISKEHKLVVSPLAALMEDQVYGEFCGLGIHGWFEWCNGEEGEDKQDH